MRCALALVLAVLGVRASAAEPALDAAQRQGRQLFVQSCGICHLKPNLAAERYGPALSQETVAGKEEGARALILGGSQRMPGFQYDLTAAQIDAIIGYLKTVPAASATPPQTRPRGATQAD